MTRVPMRSWRLHLDRKELFRGGASVRPYLKQEEVGLAIVSEPLNFQVFTEDLGEVWSEFSWQFKTLLGKMGGKRKPRNQYRLIICSVAEPTVIQQPEGQPEVVSLPMKVKLVSNIRLESPRAEREEGCLVRLARVFDSQNLEIIVEDVNVWRISNNPNDAFPLRLSWNEDDLCWEADGHVSFKPADLASFGKEGCAVGICPGLIDISFTNSGVSWMLQHIYGKHCSNWRLQKELLENGEYSDMEIISKNAGSDSGQMMPIKCHRVHLAGASSVFAKMFGEEGNDGKGQWKEGQSRSVTLPESEDAIRAMLDFIYYGGCERIFRNRVEVILELLEAGEKYQIPSLVDVAAFVLQTDAKEENWFTADAALQLFSYARHLEGKPWDELKSRSLCILEGLDQSQRVASAQYQELFNVVAKLGLTFVNMLEGSDEATKPTSLRSVGSDVTTEEAMLVYELISYSFDFKSPRDLDVALGIMTLAEFCGQPPPRFANANLANRLFQDYHKNNYEADYLIELFCFARKKSGECWENLKKGAVQFLQKLLVEHPEQVRDSKKYGDLLHKDPEAFEEFFWLCNQGCADVIRRRKRGYVDTESDTD